MLCCAGEDDAVPPGMFWSWDRAVPGLALRIAFAEAITSVGGIGLYRGQRPCTVTLFFVVASCCFFIEGVLCK